MIDFLIIITIVAIFIPVYVYIGYPVMLMVLNILVDGKAHQTADISPTVSLVVSCYNEVDIIEQKIKNCLSIDYPRQKLEIIFVSDGSDDGTDAVIERYCDDHIKHIRQEGRLGKTMGLNLALAQASGEIVVFSDANAMYEEKAIRMLVRNFYDESVGYVVGSAIYKDDEISAAGSSENAYWHYEIFIKKIESKLHSVVGGDGAIYAIRRSLYEPLDREDINDFVNPLQIIAKGYRGIFDADAVCYEQTAGDFDKEGRRKQRIVNRSFAGLMKNKNVLNPFQYGFYSLEIISHKLLRWMIPFFLLLAGIGITILAYEQVELFQWALLLGILFVWVILVSRVCKEWSSCPSILTIPYYFYLVNISSMKGVIQSLRGNVQVTWSTPRENRLQKQGAGVVSAALLIIFIVLTVWVFTQTLSMLVQL